MIDVKDMLSGLRKPLSDGTDWAGLKLGDSFAINAELRKLLLLSEVMRIPSFGKMDSALDMERKLAGKMDRYTRLCLFTVLFNECFDLKRKRVAPDMEPELRSVARDMKIGDAAYEALAQFFAMDKPYTDTREAVYLSPENSNQLIKSKGVHVYFKHQRPNELLYLKFFEDYDLFLCRTYEYGRSNSMDANTVSTREINILNQEWYQKLSDGLPSFRRLKTAIKKFDPLQRVEVNGLNNSPKIILDPEKCIIIISGAAVPISFTTYFEPILDWMQLFSRSGKKRLKVFLRFNYFNAYTARFLVTFVRQLNAILNGSRHVDFHWYYEKQEEEMKEFGEYLRSLFHEPSKFHVLETKKIKL